MPFSIDLTAKSIRRADRIRKLRKEHADEIKKKALDYVETYKFNVSNLSSDVYADLCENNSDALFKRSQNGIEKTLTILLLLLNDKIDEIESMENVEIKKK